MTSASDEARKAFYYAWREGEEFADITTQALGNALGELENTAKRSFASEAEHARLREEINILNDRLVTVGTRMLKAEVVCEAANDWDTTNHNAACRDLHEALKDWREAKEKT